MGTDNTQSAGLSLVLSFLALSHNENEWVNGTAFSAGSGVLWSPPRLSIGG